MKKVVTKTKKYWKIKMINMILWEYQLEIWSSRFHMMTLYKSINKISDAGSIIAKLPWQEL